MNIDKAIEIKRCTGEDFLHTDPDEIDEADRLSIEALKAVKECRASHMFCPGLVMPGETEE